MLCAVSPVSQAAPQSLQPIFGSLQRAELSTVSLLSLGPTGPGSRSPLHSHIILSIPGEFDPDQTSPNDSCSFHTHCHDPYRIIWMIFCKMRKQSIFVSSVTSSDRPENCHVVKCCNVFYISDNPYQVVDHENSCIESERETVNRCD